MSTKVRKELLISTSNRTSEGLNTLKASKIPIYQSLWAVLHMYSTFYSSAYDVSSEQLCLLSALTQHLPRHAYAQFIQHVATFLEFQGGQDCWMSEKVTRSCKYVWNEHLLFRQNLKFDWIMRNPYLATLVLVLGALSARAVMSLEQDYIRSYNRTNNSKRFCSRIR